MAPKIPDAKQAAVSERGSINPFTCSTLNLELPTTPMPMRRVLPVVSEWRGKRKRLSRSVGRSDGMTESGRLA